MNGVRTGKDFQSAMAPFASAGLKGAIDVYKDLHFGAFARYTWFGEMSDWGNFGGFDVEARVRDLNMPAAGAGFQYDISLFFLRKFSIPAAAVTNFAPPTTTNASITFKNKTAVANKNDMSWPRRLFWRTPHFSSFPAREKPIIERVWA